MAFVEDHGVFLDEFGVTVTLGSAQVRAIFDRAGTQASVGYSGMATSHPMLTLATADVPSGVVGLSVNVSGTDYTVAEDQPDGTGMSKLLLEAA